MTIPTSSIDQVIPGQGAMAQPEEARPAKAKRSRFRFVANAKAATGLVILGIYILFAIIGPWVAPYDPDARSDELVQPPSSAHWFGTTHLGQDVLSQILVGTRGVMVVGLTAGVVATILSVLVGVTAGYLGGGWDDTLSALSNVFLVIPALPLIIIVASTFENAGATDRRAGHRPHLVGVGRAGAARPDAVAAPARLRRGVPGDRRDDLADHPLRDPAEPDRDHRVRLRRHGHLRGHLGDHAGLHRHRRRSPTGTGARSCSGRRASRPSPRAPGGGSCRPVWPSRCSAPRCR